MIQSLGRLYYSGTGYGIFYYFTSIKLRRKNQGPTRVSALASHKSYYLSQRSNCSFFLLSVFIHGFRVETVPNPNLIAQLLTFSTFQYLAIQAALYRVETISNPNLMAQCNVLRT